MISTIIIAFMGLAGGLAVGASIVAFLSVIGIISRIIQWTNTNCLKCYQIAIILGALFSCVLYFFNLKLSSLRLLSIPIGLLMGVFVGMVAAALTETLDIISIAADKLGMIKWIYLLIFSVLLGKTFSSAIFFLIPGFF